MISPLDANVLDRNAEDLGISVRELMDNAGMALAGVVDSTGLNNILFICGSGNNGGDGYVAYRYLSSKADIMAFKGPKSILCKEVAEGIDVKPYSVDFSKYDLIVDCVLGTGISGKLKPDYVDYINAVNSSNCKVISCDVPSGYGTDFSINPDITVTFHDIKIGMNESNSGKIIVKDIGIPQDAEKIVNSGDMLRYPKADKNSHKGQNGKLLIVGGGPYVGAPIMSALSSLRIGVDLVTIATPEQSFTSIAAHSPAYMVKKLSSNVLCKNDVNTVLALSKNVDAILIGPGLGTADETIEAVIELVKKIDIPMVIDADGINCLATNMPDISRKKIVFTPHSMELKKLLSDIGDVHTFCTKRRCVILAKGEEDIIYSPEKTRINKTGSVGMTVGGTGDVLSGVVAGLIAKGMSGFDAACLGAYICGKSGEISFSEYSYGMIATDVINNIGHVLAKEIR